MNTIQVSFLVALLSLFLVSLSQSAPLSESARIRRSYADLRVAELQALRAVAAMITTSKSLVGHGLFDFDKIGKKKRDQQYAAVSDEERYNLLKELVQRAAQENTAS